MGDYRNIVMAKTKCTICGEVFEFWRKTGRKQKRGHVKHVFCIKCNADTPHKEIGGE